MALAEGRALPAGRLAEEAGVGTSTISNHLAILLEHELVTVEQQGRNRYYSLASAEVDAVFEALVRLAPRTAITSLRHHTKAAALRKARTCYRHLAGHLGVRVSRRCSRPTGSPEAPGTTTPRSPATDSQHPEQARSTGSPSGARRP
jgi:DNA-binding transcriptional ArsR family regulator